MQPKQDERETKPADGEHEEDEEADDAEGAAPTGSQRKPGTNTPMKLAKHCCLP
jgi:hypothetical protein